MNLTVRFRPLLVLLVVGVMVALTPLAQASPPDSTWIGGFYDNADYDDVVIALTSTVGVSDGVPVVDLGPAAEVINAVCPSEPAYPARAFRSPYHLRAPPLV
jgi:hypothetical protein